MDRIPESSSRRWRIGAGTIVVVGGCLVAWLVVQVASRPEREVRRWFREFQQSKVWSERGTAEAIARLEALGPDTLRTLDEIGRRGVPVPWQDRLTLALEARNLIGGGSWLEERLEQAREAQGLSQSAALDVGDVVARLHFPQEMVWSWAKGLSESSNATHRRAAAAWLGTIQDPAATGEVGPRLISLLGDSDMGVRHAAVWSLQRWGRPVPEAVPALTSLLDDPTHRRAAIEALGGMGPASASVVPRLEQWMSKTAKAVVRMDAAIALLRIVPDHSEAANRIREALSPRNGRSERSYLLARLGNVPEVAKLFRPEIRSALDESDPSIWGQAASALKRMQVPTGEWVSVLERRLGSKSGGDDVGLAWTLMRVDPGNARALDFITRSSPGTTDPWLFLQVVRDAGPAARSALPWVDQLRSHQSRRVRVAAYAARQALLASEEPAGAR